MSFTCEKCDKEFKTNYLLNRHYKNKLPCNRDNKKAINYNNKVKKFDDEINEIDNKIKNIDEEILNIHNKLEIKDNKSFDKKEDFNIYVKLILNNLSLSVVQQLDSSPWVLPWAEIKQRVLTNTQPDPEEYKTAKEGFVFLEDLQFDKLLAELKAA